MTTYDSLRSIVPTDASRTAAIVLAVCLVGAVAATGAALAQDDPEAVPASYYGTVTVEDGDAGGVEVAAVVDGEVADTIETADDGSFGGASASDDKLVVHADDGDEVTFEVDGERAGLQGESGDAVAWESGANDEVHAFLESDDDGVSISPPDRGSAEFTDVELVEDEVTVEPGASAEISGSVANDGDGSGLVDVALTLDGETVEEERIVVPDGDEREWTVEVSTEDLTEGKHEVAFEAADERVEGSLIVEEADDTGGTDDQEPDPGSSDDGTDDGTDDDTDDDADDTIPGFGVPAAVAALVAGALALVRRRTDA